MSPLSFALEPGRIAPRLGVSLGLNANAIEAVRNRLANRDGMADDEVMASVLRIASMWRSKLIANTVMTTDGVTVQSGPFAGMQYATTATEGALLPRLLGIYESQLHPHIEALARQGLDRIVDVGCAEGYYAVGFARLLPNAIVHAHDTDPAARALCAELAALNGVAERVRMGGAFDHADFEAFAGPRTLVFMDIEGGEAKLLDPVRAPALRTVNIIVETHPGPGPLCDVLAARFEATHEIVRIDQTPQAMTDLPPLFRKLSHLDQLIAAWEWRRWLTPWLVMRPKAG